MAENGGIKFAIRLYETGEEKVARQMARLDRKLQLLGGKSAAGFYSGGVFGKKVHDRFFGKGSRSFRKQVQKLMLDIAVTVTLEIISMSKGTTGNTASAWYISIDENEHDYGKFQNDPEGYIREHAKARKTDSIFHANKAEAINRESMKQNNNKYLPAFKNRYTVYITNYAFVAENRQIRQFTFDGYHAAKFYDTPELGMYKAPHFLANIDTYIQGRYKELFNAGIQRILKNLKGN